MMKYFNQSGIFVSILFLVTLQTAEIIGSSQANDGGPMETNEKNPQLLTEEDVISLVREARQKNSGPDLLKGVGTQLVSGAQNLFTGVEHFVVNLLAGINDVNFQSQGIEPITPTTPDPDEETTINEEEETSPFVRTTVAPPVTTTITTTTRPTTTTPRRRRSRPTTPKAAPSPPVEAAPSPAVPAIPAPAYLPVLPPYQPGQVPIYQILLPGYPHPVPVYQQLPVQSNEPSTSSSPPAPLQNEQPFKLTGIRGRPTNGQQEEEQSLISVGGLKPIVPSNSEIFKIYPPSQAPFRRRHETTKAVTMTRTTTQTPPPVTSEVSQKPVKNRVTWPEQSTKRWIEYSTRRRLFVSNTAKPPPAPPKNPPFGTIFKPKEPENIYKESRPVASIVPDEGFQSSLTGQGQGQSGSSFGGPLPSLVGPGEGQIVQEILTEGPEIVTDNPGEQGPTTEEEAEVTDPETEESRDSRA